MLVKTKSTLHTLGARPKSIINTITGEKTDIVNISDIYMNNIDNSLLFLTGDYKLINSNKKELISLNYDVVKITLSKVLFSNEGNYYQLLAIAKYNTMDCECRITIYDVQTFIELNNFIIPMDGIEKLIFSDDGKTLAFCFTKLSIINLQTNEIIDIKDCQQSIINKDFLIWNNNLLLHSSNYYITVFNRITLENEYSFPFIGYIFKCFKLNNTLIVILWEDLAYTVKIFDINSYVELDSFPLHILRSKYDIDIFDMILSNDGNIYYSYEENSPENFLIKYNLESKTSEIIDNYNDEENTRIVQLKYLENYNNVLW